MARRVLLVDDDPDIRRVVKLVLEDNAGWEVWEAADGEEAVHTCREDLPDVILMDVLMGGMDGYEAARKIMDECGGEGAPVIMFSATKPEESVLKKSLHKIIGHIKKPFNPATLEEEILAILEKGAPR